MLSADGLHAYEKRIVFFNPASCPPRKCGVWNPFSLRHEEVVGVLNDVFVGPR